MRPRPLPPPCRIPPRRRNLRATSRSHLTFKMSMFDDDLIENVKKYPVLYRNKLKNYKSMINKGNCWIAIGEALNKTPEECKSKWRNIRDNYNKNKKKKIAGGASSYSKYDDEKLNFLSDSYDDGLDETSNTSNLENATSDPIEITYECVKEEYDSSEEVPLAQSPFMIGTSKRSFSEQPAAYPPSLVATAYGTISPGLTAQQLLPVHDHSGAPPPKRAMKRKIDSIIEELKKDREERNVILQQLVTKATSPAGRSPIHNFFSSMADIACNFPPEKIAELRLKVCSIISEVELSILKDNTRF